MPPKRHHAPLALVTALLCLGLVRAAAAPAFARDPLLDMALSELLSQPLGIARSSLDVQLQLAATQCRERSVGGRLDGGVLGWDSSGGDDDDDGSQESSQQIEDDASTAAYCEQVRQSKTKERANKAKREQQPETKRLPQEIAMRNASGVELQEFFETYAETARPVVLTAPAASEGDATTLADEGHEVLGFASDEELAQFRNKCFGSTPGGNVRTATLPLKIHNAECVPLLERFRVPMLLVHDYIRRTNVSLSDTYLPSLARLHPQSSRKAPDILACPHGLHMLAMAFPETTESESGDIQVFDQRFKPLQQSSNGRKSSGDGVEEVAISASSGGFFGRDSEHGDSSFLAQITPLYHTRELLAKRLLFVPGSQFATIRPTTTEAAAGDHRRPQTLLRFCFVDASSFSAVKQEVAVEALVSSEAQTLLQSLQSQAFDRSMFRHPAVKDSLWGNFVTWSKETKLLKKSDLLNSEAGSEQLQLSRRERLKQWQDDKRWDRRVESLTLPVSLPPVVVNTTRNSATLRFQDLYELPKHDITAYGYTVRWKNVDSEQDHPVPSLAGDESEPSDANAMNITRKQIVRSVLPTALFGDDFDGKDIEAVVFGLEAETRCTFTVQICVDETSGLESDRSRVVQTTPCSEPSGVRGVPTASDGAVDATCATLQWLDPIDDGGKQVGLYLISTRIVEDAFDALARRQDSTTTVEDEKVFTLEATFAAPSDAGGAWKTAQVCRLVPGAISAQDLHALWEQNRIPCVLALQDAS